jgi:prephenate dehydrogenase
MTPEPESTPFFSGSDRWIPAALADAKVTVWGIGLMGGSLAMALQGKTAALYGIDPDAQTCRQAEQLHLFDRVSTDPAELLPLADLIVLAAPLGILPALLQELPGCHPGPSVVIDLGSTKTAILEVMQQMPQRFAPLGGHPMCGKEFRTLSQACATLYQGASFALLPLPRTSKLAANLAVHLVEAAGAHVVWLDPATHDRWAASISALPYLASNGLASITPLDAAPLVGPGFTSTTRLADESIDMMLDILSNNRANVLESLQAFCAQMQLLEQDLEAADFDALRSHFQAGADRHAAVLNSFRKGEKK